MTSQSSAALLVESVAQALVFAINDPAGHSSWTQRQQTSICKRRRGAQETQRVATVFDSSAIPPIGIDKYLMRLSATFRCSESCFIAALILVDRLLEYDGGRLPLTMRNVHRIYLASLVVTVKYHEDLVYSNHHYAKCGGVHLREVNRLERVLLMALGFDIRVEPEQFQLYEAALRKLRGPMKDPAICRAGPTPAVAPSPRAVRSVAPAATTTTVPPPKPKAKPEGYPEGQPEGRPEGKRSVAGATTDNHGIVGGDSGDRASTQSHHESGASSSTGSTGTDGSPWSAASSSTGSTVTTDERPTGSDPSMNIELTALGTKESFDSSAALIQRAALASSAPQDGAAARPHGREGTS